MTVTRALPRLDADNRAFWTGGADNELRIMRCRDCEAFIHPPRPICRNCLSENVAPEVVAGTGAVETFTLNYQQWRPGMDVPFVIARVTLDGVPGVFLTTNIVGCPAEEVDVGDRVRVTFEQHDDIYLPLFERIT
ncbi:MAG: putative OB-fold protein [Halieaceae bacterium]|jgi:uncharacterized OB-fold protein